MFNLSGRLGLVAAGLILLYGYTPAGETKNSLADDLAPDPIHLTNDQRPLLGGKSQDAAPTAEAPLDAPRQTDRPRVTSVRSSKPSGLPPMYVFACLVAATGLTFLVVLAVGRGREWRAAESAADGPAPPNFRIRKLTEAIQIEYRWFQSGFAVAAYFLFFMLAALGAFVVLDFQDSSSQGAVGSVVGTVLGLPLLALLYWCVAAFFNVTTARAAGLPGGVGLISVRTGPFPWPANRDVRTDGLRLIRCRHWALRTTKGSHHSYDVQAVYWDGSEALIWRGFPSGEEADYLARQLAAQFSVPAELFADQASAEPEDADAEDNAEDDQE